MRVASTQSSVLRPGGGPHDATESGFSAERRESERREDEEQDNNSVEVTDQII